MSREYKKKISVTIDAELVEWIDKRIKTRLYRNRSHGVEVALAFFINHIEKGELTHR